MHTHQFNHRVTLQSNVKVQDPATGYMTQSWVDVAKVYAAVAPLSAREFVAAQAVQADVTTRITIRYRAGVTAAMRILHDGKVYNITGVLPDAKSGREYLTLPCTELPAS